MSENEWHNGNLLVGDVMEKILEIPDESVDCEISSYPYYNLRDYGVKGQIGLEPTFQEYLEVIGKVTKQLKRILKPTGSCWINLGDTYAGSGKGAGTEESKESWRFEKTPKLKDDLPNKTRYGIPERFYINCIDDGWIARNHIPWYKSNAMPTSVKDRFANKWESIFFFVKNQKYYFDLDAVREKTLTETKPFNVRVRDSDKPKFLQKALDSEKENHNERGERTKKIEIDWTKQDNVLGPDGKPIPTYKGFNERWQNRSQDQYTKRVLDAREDGAQHDNPLGNLNGKNPGDVFFINPKPFKEAHFATFPLELPEKIIKCACPEGGVVFDPFMGAGTVALAALNLNRKWLGIELNPEYVEIIKKRLDPKKNYQLEMFE